MPASPNILFIMADQFRADALGCVGGWAQTPNLDRLAARGTLFVNAVTSSPVCIPARVSQATGRYPHNTHVWANCHYALPSSAATWMQTIRARGYRTCVVGKTHLHPHDGDLRDREDLMHAYGLDDVNEIGGPRASARCGSYMTDEWERAGLWAAYREDYAERFAVKPHMVRPSPLGLENYYDVYVGRKTTEYIASYDRQEPWFCWASFGGPHEPWDAPEPYATMYEADDMPPPIPRSQGGPNRPRGVLDEQLGRPSVTDRGDIASLRANYAGNVTLIDDQIGRILAAVEQRQELENTVIVFTSDHGEMNGDHGLLYKSNFLDSAVRVPLVVALPETFSGSGAGTQYSGPVEWFDVGPTLVEAAGGHLEHQQFAASLLPVIANPSGRHREDALSEIFGEMMMMTADWKIALNAEGQAYLLFDLLNDPAEQNNLAGASEATEVETRLRLRVLERLAGSQLSHP